MRLSGATRRSLRRRLELAQAEGRLPSLVVAMGHLGELDEELALGQADYGAALEAGADVQYRIGSITKTLTAAAVMQLCEAGRLDLLGTLGQAWPDAPHPEFLLTDLLSHGSGLQREVPGDTWENFEFPLREQLAGVGREARQLHPRGSWWHYSNLGFALLGELVARASEQPWEDYIGEHLLRPLGMTRTSLTPEAPAARGYSVAPFSDDLVEEPAMRLGAVAPAGELWSTARDLLRWAGALAGAHPEVLSASVMEQMQAVRTIADLEHWTMGWGLGLMLLRERERVFVGHTGGMPGFVAAVVCDPKSGEAVAVTCNSDSGIKVGGFAAQLLGWLLDTEPPVTSWSPGEEPPEIIRGLLGHWWSEWQEWTFSWRQGHLEAIALADPQGAEPTRFRRLDRDRFVADNGRERGEELLVVRGPEGGEVERLYWATYPFTRLPEPFGRLRAGNPLPAKDH